MRKCKHGLDPETGPGLWCPMCDIEQKRREKPLLRRIVVKLFGVRA